MTIKVYISGICGSNEVRKHQQRVLFILQALPIDLQVIDVTEPGRDEDLIFMQETAKKHDKKTQLPPQIFNDDVYCGDYADFELANDDDDIMKFLKLESGPLKGEILKSGGDTITQNGINHEDENEVSEIKETDHSNIIENSDISDEKSALQVDENVLQLEEKNPESEETEPNVIDSDKIDQKVSESEEAQQQSSDIVESKREEESEEESGEESE